MLIRPSAEEFRQLAGSGEYDVIPVCMEILSDTGTTIEVLRRLMKESPHCFLLESAADDGNWGRWSFLGYAPKRIITTLDGITRIHEEYKDGGTSGKALESMEEEPCTRDGVPGTKEVPCTRDEKPEARDVAPGTEDRGTRKPPGRSVAGEDREDPESPQEVIRKVLARHRSPRIEGMPPFIGGLVGYFSYEYIQYAERSLDLRTENPNGFRDLELMQFDQIIAFDHYRQKLLLIVNVPVEEPDAYESARKELNRLKKIIRYGEPHAGMPGKRTSPMRSTFTEAEYRGMVEKAKQHIVDGDIFQIVLSNGMEADYEGSLLDTYRMLRSLNPSPYMVYMSTPHLEIAAGSPETLVKLEDGILHTFPLAGTRKRGGTASEDQALEEDLLHDEKELAEHDMLVDLGRNDLGKVSRFGSVAVERYHIIEKFSHVMHIGSTVRGEIRSDRDAVDAIDAVLPAGTLSGAPKIRACQRIRELENDRRGLYGGAMGYIGYDGNMDCCIAIRTAFKANGKVFVRSGAGIVADSVPEKEYQECRNKAAAVVRALEEAEEIE